jgi:hypothetical protein
MWPHSCVQYIRKRMLFMLHDSCTQVAASSTPVLCQISCYTQIYKYTYVCDIVVRIDDKLALTEHLGTNSNETIHKHSKYHAQAQVCAH